MSIERAINIAKGCVMASAMDSETKQAVLEGLNSVAISKTETTSARALSCWYCTEIEKHGVVAVKTVLDEDGRELDACETPYNYCPNCGRRLDWFVEF